MKNWRKMLETIGGYDNELVGVPSGGVKEMVEEIESLRRQLADSQKREVMLRDTVLYVQAECDPPTWVDEVLDKALAATDTTSTPTDI